MAAQGSQRCIIVFDGGLPSIVAAIMRPQRDDLLLWIPPVGSPASDCQGVMIGPRHAAAAKDFAQWAGLPEPLSGGELRWPDGPAPAVAVLLLACGTAARAGCDEVVWPIARGGDPDGLFTADETASALSRLISLPGVLPKDAGSVIPDVRAPLVELTERQVADIAVDLDAPVELCWWWRERSGGPPDQSSEGVRWIWESALEASRGALRGA